MLKKNFQKSLKFFKVPPDKFGAGDEMRTGDSGMKKLFAGGLSFFGSSADNLTAEKRPEGLGQK